MYENYSILFVDDEKYILSSLRRSLLEEEFTCHFAESAMRAIDILEAKKVDVIITDMRMPEMNGLELLKHVEANYPMIIKLVLSGYTQLPQVLATINNVDIFNFITKPWNIEELIVILHKALDYYILQEDNLKYKMLLETKNQSYQNILKRIDDVVDNAKKNTELLRICGNEVICFGKNFNIDERIKYYDIFAKTYDIYNVLSKAITIERKAYGCSHLQLQITELISQQFPDAKIDNKSVIENTFNANKQMLDAMISSIMILFHEEFTQNGLYVNFTYASKFKISIISPNAIKSTVKTGNGLTVTDAKMVFIKNIADKTFDLCQITLQVINKDGNLVIGFSFEEQ